MDNICCCGFWLIGAILMMACIYSNVKEKVCNWWQSFGLMSQIGDFNLYPSSSSEEVAEFVAVNKMGDLIREIIKVRYCTIILNNPPLTEKKLSIIIDTLKALEKQFPNLKKNYSPTQYIGYVESMAVQAYGKYNWYLLKRTLDLTRE